jgi:hypothetical protein
LAAVNDVAKGEEIRDIIFEDEPRYTFFRFVHDYKGTETTSNGTSHALLIVADDGSIHLFVSGKFKY